MSVMPSEAGCAGEIKLRALLNRFQDVAGLAVRDREGSPGALMKRGYAWVLLRYSLEVVRRLPGIDEDISIETRHTLNDGFYTLRVFRVFSSSNETETLVLAKTSWVLIDLAAGRPVRAVQHLPEVFSGVADDPPIDPDFSSIPRLSGSKPKNAENAPLPAESERIFPVRFHDLDANGHVNNAVYFEWAFEATPLDPLAWGIRQVDAEFRASAKLGDTVLVKVREEKNKEENKEEKGAAPDRRTFVYEMTDALRDADIADAGDSEPGRKARSLARFHAVWSPLEAQPAEIGEGRSRKIEKDVGIPRSETLA
jgi:acyl-ACP thioesterase